MSKNTTFGLSFTALLVAAFIVMKVARIGAVADWSWWWVFSPLWIELALVILVILAVATYQVLKDRLGP